MKKLKFKDPYNHHYEYTDDIDRIVKVFAERGYEISREDCVKSWEKVSYDHCAGWLCLGEDDDFIFQNIFYYLEEVE